MNDVCVVCGKDAEGGSCGNLSVCFPCYESGALLEWETGKTKTKEENEMTKKRTPLLEIDWFRETRKLAIADVVYVEGIGLCSHQPDFSGPDKLMKGHRMMTVEGDIHFVQDDSLLFCTTREEKGKFPFAELIGLTT